MMPTHVDVVPNDIELERRLFGLEGEHGIASRDDTVKSEACTRIIGGVEDYPGLYDAGTVNHLYLSNGSRFYMDTGSHLEYATPECLTIRDLVASDWAGKLLIREFCGWRKGVPAYTHTANTRVVDDLGHTWGSHENYRTNSNVNLWLPEKIGTLIAHLATRNILVGAGRMIQAGHERFVISQKTHDVVLPFAASTTTPQNKPFVLTRQEALADAHHQRVQIVGGDPTMSPWATAVRMGSTSLVLRLIEAGIDMSDLAPASVKKANYNISRDLGLRKKIETQSGRSLRALDIQKALAHRCLEFAKTYPVPEEEVQIAIEWANALDELQEDPVQLADRSDWVAKRHLIEQTNLRGKANQESGHDVRDLIWSIDYLWGELSPSGIGMKLVERGKLADPLDAVSLAERYTCEPPAGRAKQRGDFIRLVRMLEDPNRVMDISVDWQRATSQALKLYVRLEDPFGMNIEAEHKLGMLRDVVYAD